MLESLLHKIQNINSPTSDKLQELGIVNYWDLLLHIPTRYQDLTSVQTIGELLSGQTAQFDCEIMSVNVSIKKNKQLHVVVSDGTGIATLMFFHFYPNYKTQYQVGKRVRVYGEVKNDYYGQKTLIHPKVQALTSDNIELPESFSPVYRLVKGVSLELLRRLVDNALSILGDYEYLPQDILEKYRLPRLSTAFRILHKLTPDEFEKNLQAYALQRLKFDELISQQLLLRQTYLKNHSKSSIILKPRATYTKELLANLEFELTKAQKKVLGEIYADIAKNTQMNRLLQGDVGSGKTIVATLSMLVAVENKHQACIVAPTEILAEQHYIKTVKLVEPLGIKVVWLSGSLTKKQKEAVYQQIKDKTADIVIGTHAIFQKNVEFDSLAIVVVDEQHRFGVNQRLDLLNKGLNPHQLMMSATPIPRTLAMTYYADLDISTIDELPSGRKPIKTILVDNNRKYDVIKYVEQKIISGAQVYWVCPLIEESEVLNLENATNVFNELQSIMPDVAIGLVHGKLKAREKAQIMAAFKDNQLKILVATTVIEVGVDVPNASVMIIEHSERMGLSTLHQLRGRVGRGSIQSECVLLYQTPLGEIAKRRLKVIYENTDGFKIAQEDLLIRGPGEILGSKQSGLPDMRFANIEEDIGLLNIIKSIIAMMHDKYIDNTKQLINIWFYHQQDLIST